MKRSEKKLLNLYTFVLLAGSCIDFFDIAWGTGVWLGDFALTWAILFAFFCFCCLLAFTAVFRVIWNDKSFSVLAGRLIGFRNHLGRGYWLLAAFVFVFPIWLLQFTFLGIVFKGLFLRLSLWTLQLFFLSFLFTAKKDVLIDWKAFLFCLVLTAGTFSIFASLKLVTGYPFSLGWSEGNRLWDYSILFGRARYDYPDGQKIDVLLETGRQMVGGLPFLIPGLTIKMERMWIGLVSILPYILLGLVVFRTLAGEKYIWLGAVLWTYLFLKQGPINPSLVLCAVLVALAWRNKLWLSGLLVLFASYAAYISRYTWTFAPAMWFVLLEFLDAAPAQGNKLNLTPRIRSFLKFSFLGLIGAVIVSGALFYFQPGGAGDALAFFRTLEISPENVQEKISQQALLWYRLLPNETYGSGILIGLILAILPLVLILSYLLRQGKWNINVWQKWVMALILSAFLTVGLVVSTKIGGGGDLHNMDMLLIGLFFVTLVAFYNGGKDWLQNSQFEPLWIKVLLVSLIAIPAIGPLQEMRSYNNGNATPWLVALTDASSERALDIYPSEQVTQESLNTIQNEVDLAKVRGEVLFMDQRQLLTFGFVEDVPLVPDYDKKVLMERALTKDRGYFREFYEDLEAGRFSLIIVQPLNTPRKGSDFQFGEENNAWVKWVANPLLCFYEIKQTLIDVNVQLLVPGSLPVDCAEILP
jgi:hypothetical protein